MKKLLPPFIWIVAYQIISAVIGFVTRDNMGWYATLAKSSLNPPDIVFPIMWTCLYVLLALAGWRMWRVRHQDEARLPFALYWIQMILNWGWSFVFFAFHAVIIGFLWIVVLEICMFAFVVAAWSRYRLAALLVLPTLLWGGFAAYLSYSIWILN